MNYHEGSVNLDETTPLVPKAKMMSLSILCHGCKKNLRLKDERLAGKKIKCPNCQTVLQVPGSPAPAAPVSPAAPIPTAMPASGEANLFADLSAPTATGSGGDLFADLPTPAAVAPAPVSPLVQQANRQAQAKAKAKQQRERKAAEEKRQTRTIIAGTVAILCLLLSIVGIFAYLQYQKAAFTHGYPSASWIPELAQSDSNRLTAAKAALRDGGQRSVPAIMVGLQSKSAKVRAACVELIGQLESKGEPETQALISGLEDKDSKVVMAALVAVKDLGVAAKPAVPRLMEICFDNDGDVSQAAADTLLVLDPNVLIGKVSTLVKSDDLATFRQGAAMMPLLRERAAPFVDEFMRKCESEDQDLRGKHQGAQRIAVGQRAGLEPGLRSDRRSRDEEGNQAAGDLDPPPPRRDLRSDTHRFGNRADARKADGRCGSGIGRGR